MSQITSKVIVPHNLFKLEFLLASGIRSWAGWVDHFNRSPPWCTLLHDGLLLLWWTPEINYGKLLICIAKQEVLSLCSYVYKVYLSASNAAMS
jgi:hypothetical protein